MVHTALPLHARPTACLLGADPQGPRAQPSPRSSGCNARAQCPTATAPGEAKPGAGRERLATLSPKPRLLPFLDRGRRSRSRRHLGAPAEGLLHHLDVHAAVPAPSEHSRSGHPALSGSSITSTRRPDGSPREPRGRTAAAALRAGDAAAGEGPRRDSGFAPDMGGGQRP